MSWKTQAQTALYTIILVVASGCAGEETPEGGETASASESYRGVADWPNLPPEVEFGDMSGVDVDSHGHVLVVHRGDRGFSSADDQGRIPEPVVVTLEANSGNVVQAWGENTFGVPHGLTIDHEDNVWITDVALHQIFKFSHDGELLLTVGQAGVPGWDETHFNRPTQVAVLPDGSFYVGDGYVNSRIAKFDAEGEFEFEWGEPGTGPGQFDNPHGVVIGLDGNVIVSDRENSRLQLFTPDGTFISEWLGAAEIGRVFSTEVGPDGSIYLAIRPEGRDPLRTGVLKLNSDFELVAQIGFKDTGDAVFQAAHYAAIGHDGAVYLAETPDRRISKYLPIASAAGG